MRTTIKDENSKYHAVVYFFHNGYTASYFDNKPEMIKWIRAMEEKHGTITKRIIEEV